MGHLEPTGVSVGNRIFAADSFNLYNGKNKWQFIFIFPYVELVGIANNPRNKPCLADTFDYRLLPHIVYNCSAIAVG